MKYPVILLTMVAMALTACTGHKTEEASTPEIQITADQSLEVLLRTEPRAKKVCYDGGRYGWYVFWDKEEGYANSGWYYVSTLPFYRIEANNSWYTTPIPDDKWIQVAIDPTGLPCKDR